MLPWLHLAPWELFWEATVSQPNSISRPGEARSDRNLELLKVVPYQLILAKLVYKQANWHGGYVFFRTRKVGEHHLEGDFIMI
jgi:hypothetical protein